ncbi:MAG: hypothetical protein H6741_27145 [Alphaproteobacteria bacterium]|nr:hypothetical protein [Alphaproteobacteria bacterium]
MFALLALLTACAPKPAPAASAGDDPALTLAQANALLQDDRCGEALPLLDDSLRHAVETYGEASQESIIVLQLMGHCFMEVGDLERAGFALDMAESLLEPAGLLDSEEAVRLAAMRARLGELGE